MRKHTIQLFVVSMMMGAISIFILPVDLNAQQSNPLTLISTDEVTDSFNEIELRERMKHEGLSQPVIDTLVAQRKSFIQNMSLKHTHPQVKDIGGGNPVVLNCADLGVENGWGAWMATPGITNFGGPVLWHGISSVPSSPRWNLTSGTGIDPCTPGSVAGSPTIPVVAPGFGSSSIQLGVQQKPGYHAEKLTFQFTPTAQDTNFVYTYAVVLYDPNNAPGTVNHAPNEKPYVDFVILDSTGAVVPCSYKHYISAPNIPGFFKATLNNAACWGGDAYNQKTSTSYRPWTLVGVNLTNYIGNKLTVVVTNVDCSEGGHYAHSYWDFQCGPIVLAAGCVGNQSTITAPASDGSNPYSYQWYQNGAIMPGAVSQNVIVTPAIGDTFSVKVSQSSGCNFYLTYVPAVVTPDFNYTGQCGNYIFTDSSFASPSASSTITNWNWSFPGGSPATATTATASVTYPPGNYTASLTITSSAGCTATTTHTINVTGSSIAANFNAPPVCAGNPTQFTDLTVGATSWNWNFGDGNTSSLQNPSNTYAAAGTYTATLIAAASGGGVCAGDTIAIPVTVNPFPVSNFNYTSVGSCSSGIVNFVDSSYTPNGIPMVSWNWNFPGGTPSSSTVQTPPNISYPPGTYTVTLIVSSQDGCTDTVDLPVTIPSGIPPVAAAATVPVCFNNPSQFTDMSTGNPAVSQWNWDFGDGNSAVQQNPSHTYGTAGTFSVTLIITSTTGCKDTVSLTTTINPLPVVNFSSSPVCMGDTTCLNDLSLITPGTITGWSWNFGDLSSGAANTSALQSPCHVYSAPGTFSVILTVTSDNGCQSTTTLPAVIHPFPTAAFTSTLPCLGSSIQLTDGSVFPQGDPIVGWNWIMSGGNPLAATSQNTSTMYSTPGAHTVSLAVITQQGCTDTITQQVLVYNSPVVNFSQPDSGCAPVYVSYTDLSTSADGTINNWQWSFPGGTPSSSSTQNPQNICYTTAGSYGVSLLVTSSYGCTASLTLPMVEVYPWPTADFCVTPLIAPATDPVFNFCDMWSNDVVQWSWNFGDNSTDLINTDPIHSYSATANANDFYAYNICIRVENQHGCWDTTCKVVELVPEFEFYIPNTFTPNGDWLNEMFYGKSRGVKEYAIWLFDRWGNQIWDCHKEDKNTNWDSDATIPRQEGLSSFCQWDGVVVQGGADMGGDSKQLAQEDVYVWKVALTDIFDKQHNYVGHVNIVR